jgi:hypothetical protein
VIRNTECVKERRAKDNIKVDVKNRVRGCGLNASG